MKQKVKSHTHKFMRVTIGGRKVIRDENGIRRIIKVPGTEVFKCMFPGCPTYMLRELVLAYKSICWRCGEELVLNMENTTLKKPTHSYCRRTRENAA